MLAYGNVLFSVYCSDFYFKKGLTELVEQLYISAAPANRQAKISGGSAKVEFFFADIVVLSSKSLFEKLPARNQSLGNDSNGVIVFCSENMSHVVHGIAGYENALILPNNISLTEISTLFLQLIFGKDISRKSLFTKCRTVNLTRKERCVSELLRKGLDQRQIVESTGMSAKAVSSHLRSAMMKYNVTSLMEYRVKLLYIHDHGYG
ncbi:hypothetical protein J6Z66_003134 [Escherichia coli]|uniref:helix-turn-helix transcriptional regulator n=1 Tax=Escherichia coli TaxID=562 RepID=UPI001DB45DF9|nr:hypothetical protein [Escherichia coli]HAV8511576.1 hypothetical protein [Escherichia coli]